MKTIKFCRKGEAISDFDISMRVDEFLNSNRTLWRVSTALVIGEIRARIREDKIDPEALFLQVEDYYGDINDFKIDKNGRSKDWVDSLEVGTSILMRIM